MAGGKVPLLAPIKTTAIADLAQIFKGDWFMVIFYGDESGTHGKGDYIVSGYLAHKSTWEFFGEAWNDALHAPTPRRIEYLHMSERERYRGQFVGWSDEDANIKVAHMISVLRIFLRNGSLGEFTSSINWDLYRRCVNGYCLEIFDDPYYFNLRQITLQAVRLTKEKDPSFNGKIHYVFDQGNCAEKNASKHFGYTKRYAEAEVAECMGTIAFGEDKDEPGLQAADLIAWHTRRHYAGIDSPSDIREVSFNVLQDSPLT
jgi:hypothetical protein